MIVIKSAREIALMKEAGQIVAKTHDAIKKVLKPGMTTREVDAIVESTIRSWGAVPSFKGYGGFPGSACTSVNEEVIHGIPSDRPLKEGDLFKVDIGAFYQGYHGDSAWTYAIGQVSKEAKRLMEVTEQSLYEGLKVAKEGHYLSDISHAIQQYVEANGMSVVREFVGHGVGKELHEDPQVPNYGLPGKGPRLKAGMTLAIEPMINLGHKEVKVLDDGWTAITVDRSLSAHYEHTILITETDAQLLTIL